MSNRRRESIQGITDTLDMLSKASGSFTKALQLSAQIKTAIADAMLKYLQLTQEGLQPAG